MTLKLVANEDMTVDIKETAPTSATLAVASVASTTVKIGDAGVKGVYRGDTIVNITNATDGTYTQFPAAPVPATITPTATKVHADSLAVLRVDDEAITVNVPGVDGGGNPGTIAITVYVSDAGQTKVEAQ